MNTDGFKDKYGPVALVTGASSGIGQSFAEVLARRGFDLVLVARRVERLEQMAARMKKDNKIQVKVCQIDLADAGAAQKMLDATAGLDVGLVVSNAGFSMKGDHGGLDAQEITNLLTVNCLAPMLLARGFIPRLKKRGKGGIILVGSVEGFIGNPFSTAYSSSKALIKSLGEGLWGELAPEGIDVLNVCPGPTDTENLARSGVDRAILKDLMSPEAVAQFALDNITNGPTLISSPVYEAMFNQLLAMPRRDALTVMARSMKAS